MAFGFRRFLCILLTYCYLSYTDVYVTYYMCNMKPDHVPHCHFLTVVSEIYDITMHKLYVTFFVETSQ
jgi:hypothetical protein